MPLEMRTVLVVDDHPDIRRLLSVTLGKSYQILEADSGEAALTAIAKYQPAIVLLDVMMPGEMDGLGVLKAIKADPFLRSTRVAMISARGQVADSEAAQAVGADAYFIKPFSPLQVVEWVRQQMEVS